MKKLFISIFLFLLFLVPNVYAVSNDLFGTQISDAGQWISLNSASTYDNRGYTLVTNGDYYYALVSGQPFYLGTYGAALTQCNLGVVPDNYYALTYAFLGDGSYYINPDYSSFGYKVGANTSFLTSQPSFAPSQVSIAQSVQVPGINSLWGDYLHTFTVVFKPPRIANCLSVAFSSSTHNVTTDEIAFVGYRFETLGSQPLTANDINTIVSNSNTYIINSITANQNATTQSVINNQNTNTQSIINNQEQNTQDMIDSQKSCSFIDKNNIAIDGKYLYGSNGIESSGANYGITDYINIINSEIVLKSNTDWNNTFCFYDVNKSLISCNGTSEYNVGDNLTIPNNANYFRSSIYKPSNKPTYEICKNGNQAINDSINDLNNNINNDNVDANDSQINDLLNDSAFQDNTGLSSVINAPLSIVSHLTDTCNPIQLHVPYIDFDLIIPCMSTSVYTKFDSSLILVIKAIINGFLVYRIIVSLYGMIKGFKDPQSDKVEVIDL